MQKSVRRDGFLRRFLLPIVIGAVVVLSAAACGDDDEAAPPAATAAPVATTAATEESAAEDFSDLRIVMLMDGSAEDGGWNTAFDRAADDIKAAFPGVQFEIVEALTRSIVKKLLHDPTSFLKERADRSQLE